MSYEIPRELRYEEKVLFNLSVWQALWLGAFLLAALAVFLKTGLPLEAKAVIAMFLAALGAGFAFFGLGEKLLAFFAFSSAPRSAGYFSREAEGFVGVKGMKGDAAILNNANAIAILEVQPLNFAMLSERHREAVIAAYKAFLNSLDFPVQIAIRTTELPLKEYFDGLELRARKSGKQAYEQFLGFRKFTEEYARRKGVKNRRFYFVVPSERAARPGENTREAERRVLEELDSRAKVCGERLRNCGLPNRRLNGNEVLALLAGYFDCMIDAKCDYLSSVTQKNTPAPQVPREAEDV